jgi:hypothetical protein
LNRSPGRVRMLVISQPASHGDRVSEGSRNLRDMG